MHFPPWFPVKGQTYIVSGLGRSGLAAIRWLHNRGASTIAADDNVQRHGAAEALGARILPPGEIGWREIAALVQSPGIPLYGPGSHFLAQAARQHEVPVIGEGDLFRLACPNAVCVGITGTNGKSTTTALVGHILKSCGIDCQVGGNIGIPLLDLPPAPVYILELSSFQLELYTCLDLDIAGWVNISPDHLDYHGALENYITAKKRIFKTDRANPVAVVGIDDPESKNVWQELSLHQAVIPVSVNCLPEKGVSVNDGWLREGGKPLLNTTQLPALKGNHNAQNIGIAYGICRALEVPPNDIIEGIRTFPGLVHRQENIGTVKGVQFINDSKATNADATSRALAAFENIYWIAGGKAKSDGIGSLHPYFSRITHAFLIGEAVERFAQTLQGKVPCTCSGTLEKAVMQAFAMAGKALLADKSAPSPVILLSPACASYDQFQDFGHRGNVFRTLVESLQTSA